MYIQLTIIANDYQQEELVALLDDFKPTGFEQKENELVAYFNEEDFDEAEIHHLLDGYDHQQERVPEKNWNEEWERNFQPVVVDGFCAIRAHFHEPIAGVKYDIVITPKMSFGTGHHATTYMMIQQMQHMDFAGKDVLDFGTGTGILAILAEKLGANNVTAIDIDEWSIDNAKENIERNNCRKINVSLSSVLPLDGFDIVLANINRNVILEFMEGLKSCVYHKGYLLVSGILQTDEDAIMQAAQLSGFIPVNTLTKDKWMSILFVNT